MLWVSNKPEPKPETIPKANPISRKEAIKPNTKPSPSKAKEIKHPLTAFLGKAQKPRELKYEIIERKMLNQALILSVSTSERLEELSQNDLREIAASLVEQNSHHYMVRVFFYNPGEIPMKDAAPCRFEWTKQQGLVLSYDRSRKPQKKPELKQSLPKYTVLDTVTLINGQFYADVLIPSFSRRTPVGKREKVGRQIAETEGFDQVIFYSTKEAYKANYSSSYATSHPNALRTGFLGSLKDGKFTSGEELY